MDNALESSRRKRLVDQANSGSAWRSATTSCILTQSAGNADAFDVDAERLSEAGCRTPCLRDFCCRTNVSVRRASIGFSAPHSAPSTIIIVLLNFKQRADVMRHWATDAAVCLYDRLRMAFTLSSRSSLDIRQHLNAVYMSTMQMMKKAQANGPIKTNSSFV
jgi:hypothetical protein